MEKPEKSMELHITQPDILDALNRIDQVDRIVRHSEVFSKLMQNSILIDIEITSDEDILTRLINKE